MRLFIALSLISTLSFADGFVDQDGNYYPGVEGGAVNPQTGQVYPSAEDGYVDDNGGYYPNVDRDERSSDDEDE